MNDAGTWRNNLEIVKCALSPTQELITLTIALVFQLHIALLSIGRAKEVSNDRVVND